MKDLAGIRKGETKDLRGAYLGGAYLRDADLRGANLEGADLEGADLRGAYLRDADLRDANLRGADLEGADLRSAYLRDADLRDANLRDAIVNWNDHTLVAEVLFQAAAQHPGRRKIAGLVLISTDWCWDDFLAIDDPERAWALGVLRDAGWEEEK